MKKTEIIKGHGFIRKTSIGLVCGIALGAVFLGANGASADEVTTPTTATPTTTATANESKTVTVDEGLTETANKAKEAGLTVNAEPTKNIGTANTEEEATKLDGQAKKEVADQKAEIEKKTNDYVVAKKESESNRKKLIDNLSENPALYNNTGAQLRALADKDYDSGKASFGEFKSSNGTVRFLDSPSRVDTGKIDPTVELLNSNVISSPKEITSYYAGASMLTNNSFVSDKQNVKVVPLLVNDGETITYKVNYTADSNLGQLGVGYVEKSYTLKGSPVQSGKIALLADRYGTIWHNYVYGGLGKANDVIKAGQWGFTSSWTYYDKDGKKIDSKELVSRFVNKYWYPNIGIKATDIKLAPTTENSPKSVHIGDEISTTKDISHSFVNGGESFFTSTRMYEELARAKNVIDPTAQRMSMSGHEVEPVVDTIVKTPTKPALNYHLVSYTVNKPKATNNADKVKKGSIVQVFIEEGGKEIAPKTNTGEKPVDETVKLSHPNEITFEGKTYTFTRQDKVDPTKIPNGTETITYVYKLKETPKPLPTPTPVEKPTTIHIDTEGKTVAPKEDGTKPFKTIDGYEPAPKDSKNVVNPKGETVRVYSQIKKGNVEVRYVKDDASRTVLKEPVADTVGGKVGSDYDTTDHKPKTITKDGVTYELVRSEGVEKGKVVEGKTVVTYVYRQTVEPTTIHIDEEGNRVAPPEKGTKPFKNIEGFEPSPKNPKNVENPKGETVRVYKVVKGDVEVRYIKDDKERTVLKEPVADTTQAKVGTKYDTTDHKPVTITKDGVTYELVRTEGTEKGDVVKGKTVVTYVYREVQKPITIHIDTEGNPVAPQEDGTKPFKEIEGYKPAPKDSKNVEDPKGVTVRVYDKVKPEAPQEAPKTPEKPEAPKPTAQAYVTKELPNTGSEASTALALAGMSILGLSGLVYKKKED